MRRSLVFVLIALAGFGVPGCLHPIPTAPEEEPRPLGEFSLTERDGRTVRRDDLRGQVWVASFIFTRCAGPCSQVSANMARLQSQLAGQEGVTLVTFTVDPDYDTPEVLREYATHYGADPQRWLFLTGPRDDMYRLIGTSFQLGVQRSEGSDRQPGYEVTHSTKLALVDQKGRIRGYFDGRQIDEEGKPVDALPDLRQAITALLREKS